MPEYRHGALYVVEESASHSELERDLKQIDRALFFERQLTFAGELVWCVVCDVGGDQPPVTLIEWRDPATGAPIPELSSGVLTRVQRMHRSAEAFSREMRARNEQLEKARDRDRDAAYEDMARDMLPRIEGRVSAVLPRSQALRRSRDRRRARGEKT